MRIINFILRYHDLCGFGGIGMCTILYLILVGFTIKKCNASMWHTPNIYVYYTVFSVFLLHIFLPIYSSEGFQSDFGCHFAVWVIFTIGRMLQLSACRLFNRLAVSLITMRFSLVTTKIKFTISLQLEISIWRSTVWSHSLKKHLIMAWQMGKNFWSSQSFNTVKVLSFVK